jgi:hypothetical protein
MSIPLINDVNKNDINTSIIAIKKNIERINTLLGLNNTEEIDTSIFATKEELEQAETDLAPVDEVTSGNMQSVTSNAVAEAIEMKVDWIGHYDCLFTNIGQSQQEYTIDLGREYPYGYCVTTCLYSNGEPPAFWTHIAHCYNTTGNNRYLNVFIWCNQGTCPAIKIAVNVFKIDPFIHN